MNLLGGTKKIRVLKSKGNKEEAEEEEEGEVDEEEKVDKEEEGDKE